MLNPDGKYCCTEDQLDYDEWKDNTFNVVENSKQGFEEHYEFECPYFTEEKVENLWQNFCGEKDFLSRILNYFLKLRLHQASDYPTNLSTHLLVFQTSGKLLSSFV